MLGGLLLALLAVLLFVGGQKLCVRKADGTLVYAASLPDKGEFCLRFVHSVAQSPVEEWFHTRQGQIVLDSTVYQDFGAGLPHAAEGPGQRMRFTNGLVQITGFNRAVPHLTVRVSSIPGHTLLLEHSSESSAIAGHDSSNISKGNAESFGQTAQIFATAETTGKFFREFRLDAWAPAGAALTFSLERCFWVYCIE